MRNWITSNQTIFLAIIAAVLYVLGAVALQEKAVVLDATNLTMVSTSYQDTLFQGFTSLLQASIVPAGVVLLGVGFYYRSWSAPPPYRKYRKPQWWSAEQRKERRDRWLQWGTLLLHCLSLVGLFGFNSLIASHQNLVLFPGDQNLKLTRFLLSNTFQTCFSGWCLIVALTLAAYYWVHKREARKSTRIAIAAVGATLFAFSAVEAAICTGFILATSSVVREIYVDQPAPASLCGRRVFLLSESRDAFTLLAVIERNDGNPTAIPKREIVVLRKEKIPEFRFACWVNVFEDPIGSGACGALSHVGKPPNRTRDGKWLCDAGVI